jgi:hypothetical protein
MVSSAVDDPQARSPLAPKKTKASECSAAIFNLSMDWSPFGYRPEFVPREIAFQGV